MLPLSGHLERGRSELWYSRRLDYRGQFLAGCAEGWCNVTSSVQLAAWKWIIWNRRRDGRLTRPKPCCTSFRYCKSPSPGVMDFPDQRVTWSRENQSVEPRKSWRGRGRWYFPAYSLILKHRCSLQHPPTPQPPPLSFLLQSVCPSDPPLNPDYYGFVFFPTCDLQKKGDCWKAIWWGCSSDSGDSSLPSLSGINKATGGSRLKKIKSYFWSQMWRHTNYEIRQTISHCITSPLKK